MKTLTTTEQALNFIQNKIAETHAAGGDILALLAHPEIAFSLQVLEQADSSLVLAPVTININKQLVQIFTMVGVKANNSHKQLTSLHC